MGPATARARCGRLLSFTLGGPDSPGYHHFTVAK